MADESAMERSEVSAAKDTVLRNLDDHLLGHTALRQQIKTDRSTDMSTTTPKRSLRNGSTGGPPRTDDRPAGNYGIDPSWGQERHRLALIEKFYDPMTIAQLTELGVAAGWRCLEIGTGGGSIARWLRDRVGPEGRVVAIDLDTRWFAAEPGIEARRADIMSDEIERDAFDLVHCRLLLHHLRGKQVEAVQRMASTLRPGGIFIASECYLGAMRASCTRAFAELWRGLYAALPNADYEWPVSLPATLQAAGLEAVDAGETSA